MNTIRIPPEVRAALTWACVILAVMVRPAARAEPLIHDHTSSDDAALHQVQCVPLAERADRKLGCFITQTELLGKLPKIPLYWHLLKFQTREAAETAKARYGSVVNSFGDIWLFTIAPASWNAKSGVRVARVGPLPINDYASYTAEYMEATFVPGMSSRVHRHPGPEAWYMLSGEQCLETPGHSIVVRAGESAVVPEGPPMQLFGTGQSERRSLVLILHDSSKPMAMAATDWRPSGLCAGTQ